MSVETRKEHIRSMVDSLVNGNDEQAEVDFHGAATDIVKDIIGIPTEPEYQEVDADVDVVDDIDVTADVDVVDDVDVE